jgi:PleD family two-component response regulator
LARAQPFVLHGESLLLTVSVGLAMISAAESRFDKPLNRASVALYAAKSNGRNRVEMSMTRTHSVGMALVPGMGVTHAAAA